MVDHIEVINNVLAKSTASEITPHIMCILGSQAFGISTPESDYDYGVIGTVAPELDWQLSSSKFGAWDSYSAHDPADTAIHELRKACLLAFKGNLTLFDFLWAEDYLFISELGKALVSHREDFLGWGPIVGCSAGMMNQFAKRAMKHRAQGLSSKESKSYRHMHRIVESTNALLYTGKYQLKVADPEETFAFGDQVRNWSEDQVFDYIKSNKQTWEGNSSKFVIPKVANKENVQNFLLMAQEWSWDNR